MWVELIAVIYLVLTLLTFYWLLDSESSTVVITVGDLVIYLFLGLIWPLPIGLVSLFILIEVIASTVEWMGKIWFYPVNPK
jgi:hypothetical protein